MPTDIIDSEVLRKLSGKHSAAAVQRWADRQGIRTLQGGDGPFTTKQAINCALGVRSTNESIYQPDDIA